MTKVKKELLANNEQINWIPAHLKEGRFGEWLNNVVDWAVSRSRYWGTPIPIWQCEKCGNTECIGSFAELAGKTGDANIRADNKDFDPHKPFVDALTWKCEKCDGAMHRVPEVMDTWFDSGSMPFAQWHWPFENAERIDEGTNFPADFISEAIDQTRGWFYTLLAVGTALGYKEPVFKNVISLGHVNDENGKKMSKHIGNVVDPWKVIQDSSADAVRWYFFTVNDPGEGKNMDPQAVQTVVRKTFMILDNVAKFYELYKGGTRTEGSTHVMDAWLQERTKALVAEVTQQLEKFSITNASRAIDDYIQDLSTWYVRRSRDRFKEGDPEALYTLEQSLTTLSKLMAPFAPFFAEALYRRVGGEKDSVHLEDWPEVKSYERDILDQMQHVLHNIVPIGHAIRASKGIKVRQPLSQAVIEGFTLDKKYVEILCDELNVQEVNFGKMPAGFESVTISLGKVGLDLTMTDELKEQGWVREFTRAVNAERKAQKFTPQDSVRITYASQDAMAQRFFETYRAEILKGAHAHTLEQGEGGTAEVKLGDMAVTFVLAKE